MKMSGAQNPDNGVIGHIPAQRGGGAAHAKRSGEETDRAERTTAARLHRAVACKREHATAEPLREAPPFQNKGVPSPADVLEGHGLVSEERGRERVSGAGRSLGELVVDGSADGSKELVPKWPRGEGGGS